MSEALQRSEDEYSTVARRRRDRGRGAPRPRVERATAALSDAVRRLRRIAEALPPALRPRAGDDPLGELPRLRETLAAEVERAEVALAGATEDLERARQDIDDTQASSTTTSTVVPTDDVGDDDLRQAVLDLVGTGDDARPSSTIPLVEHDQSATGCSTSSSSRPSGVPWCCSPTTLTPWGGLSACPTTSVP